MAYRAPTEDITATLTCVGGAGSADPDIVRAVIEEAGRLATDSIAPTNQPGDRQGARLIEGRVETPPSFAAGYAELRDGGWLGLPFPEEAGGQGLPRAVGLAVMEMLQGANMSLALCPMLSLGAIEALIAHGTAQQKAVYLPKLISGEWTGTMNLTEPQAGSDVGALTTRATPQPDGSYLLDGQKIFITWGEHELTENIVHLVLARLPDAPAGSKGISLFLCPKVLVNDDGGLGQRNGVRCIRIEEKIGIHGSPTCTMEYAGAKAWLIGKPNKGLAAMFTMMNSARVNVGVQGVGIADAAFQSALAYARERKQGHVEGHGGPALIIEHPDVRRTLALMQARAAAARAICYACSAAADAVHAAQAAGDEAARRGAQAREDLLTPIAKAWSTDAAVTNASMAVQVHGGLGFMGETLASQYYRDARIAPIYEGTNGIQAIDLIGRKLSGDGGAAMGALLAEISATAQAAAASDDADVRVAAERLALAAQEMAETTKDVLASAHENRRTALFAATPYLERAGEVIGAHFLTRLAMQDARWAPLAAFWAMEALGGGLRGRTGAAAASAADRAVARMLG